MRMPLRILPVVLMATALVHSTAVSAKERAGFIDHIYAPGDGCKKLEALDNGAPRMIDTVPDYLTEDGIQSWEGGCEFTKVFEHEPGESWVAIMVCSGGPTVMPQTYLFYKDEANSSFEVAHQGQEEPETFHRCDQVKKKDD